MSSVSGSSAIRLFRDPLADLSVEMTPEQFFTTYVWPFIFEPAGRSSRTKDEYEQTLGYCTQFTHGAGLCHFANVEVLANWEMGLQSLRVERGRRKGQPLAPNTIRKHCTHLQCVLDRAGPKKRAKRHTRNAGLLAEPPLVEKPTATRGTAKDVFTLAEVGHFIAACYAARWPRAVNQGTGGGLPSTWWRSLAIVLYNCGIRIGTAVKLRRSWLARDEHGTWLLVPAEAAKMKQPLKVYVNRHAQAAIDVMPITRDELFPWPHTMQYLDACRVKLLKRSGILPARRFGFQGIRKRANTEIGRIDPRAARMFAGHATGDVNTDHYTDASVLAEACEKLPQPPVPEIAPPPADDPQLWLF